MIFFFLNPFVLWSFSMSYILKMISFHQSHAAFSIFKRFILYIYFLLVCVVTCLITTYFVCTYCVLSICLWVMQEKRKFESEIYKIVILFTVLLSNRVSTYHINSILFIFLCRTVLVFDHYGLDENHSDQTRCSLIWKPNMLTNILNEILYTFSVCYTYCGLSICKRIMLGHKLNWYSSS